MGLAAAVKPKKGIRSLIMTTHWATEGGVFRVAVALATWLELSHSLAVAAVGRRFRVEHHRNGGALISELRFLDFRSFKGS
ncbi:hypothetical protein SDJN02_11408, partial [Cucurbita argyrosperma subsp. argyrosperma]